MESLKKINVNLEEREFVRLDAIRATRQEKWQSLLARLLNEWAAGGSAGRGGPPGTRPLYVPAELPDEYAAMLEHAARQILVDLGEGLDAVTMALKKAKTR